MTKRKRSPQDDKSLSYAKDRRNTYGENDKRSRKSGIVTDLDHAPAELVARTRARIASLIGDAEVAKPV